MCAHVATDERGMKRMAKACGPDTAVLVSSSQREEILARAVKPLRREGRSVSAEPVCSCALSFYVDLHARPRVQRAPGLPCAL
jgi:hypothetical protein